MLHSGAVILVSARDVGAPAVARMVRDGVVVAAGPGLGAATDVPAAPETRAAALDALVPRHTVLSGLAGLWVWGGGILPASVVVVGARGLHRSPPGHASGGLWPDFHSGGAAHGPWTTLAGVRVAPPERCAADALRWEDLRRALPWVWWAVASGIADAPAIAAIVRADSPKGRGADRARSAWSALARTLERDAQRRAIAAGAPRA